MNITIEKKPNCEAELHIEVESGVVRDRRNGIVERYRKLAKVPGFRPGHAPATIIEKKFAREIDGELREALVSAGCSEAAKEKQLSVISVRTVRGDTFQPDGNFTFTADLTLEPEINLPEYKEITVQAPKAEVTDAMLEARLLEFQGQFADYADVTGRALQTGDFAILTYTGAIGGQPVGEVEPKANTALKGSEGYWVRMEEEGFLPGFVAQITGMAIGETKEGVTVALEEGFPVESLAGKEIIYRVELTGIKERKLPELDDAFAARMLPGKSIGELTGVIRERLQDEVIEKRRSAIVEQILRYLDQSTETELPNDLVQRETQRRVDEMVDRGVRQGMQNEDIEAQQEQIFSAATEQARVGVKTTFLLEQIAKKEQLSVSDQELIGRISMIAQRNNKPLKKFIKELQQQNAIGNIRAQMLVGKAIDFLVLNAKVTETEAESAPESAAGA